MENRKIPKHLPDRTAPTTITPTDSLHLSTCLMCVYEVQVCHTHAEKVLVRRVGSGLGMRYPLMGDGERSLALRVSGRWREPGKGGEVGDCCEADEVGSEDIPDA